MNQHFKGPSIQIKITSTDYVREKKIFLGNKRLPLLCYGGCIYFEYIQISES